MPTFTSVKTMLDTFPSRPVQLLDHNIWNFMVYSGSLTQSDTDSESFIKGLVGFAAQTFRTSFKLQRFNTKGSARWQPTKYSVLHPDSDDAYHKILVDTGTLKNSITTKNVSDTPGEVKFRIFTDPEKFDTARKHAGFCYAAIHNDKSGSHTYGATGVPSIQRQFMGHSSEIESYIKTHASELLNGFPKMQKIL